MDGELQEFLLDHELRPCNAEVVQDGCVKDSMKDQDLDQVLQGQHNQNPESLKQDQVQQQSLDSDLNRADVQNKETCCSDPPQDQNPAESRRDSSLVNHVPDELRPDWSPATGLDPGSPQDQDQDENQDLDRTPAASNQDGGWESGVGVPALVITQAQESLRPALGALVKPPVRPVDLWEPQRPADLVMPVAGSLLADPSLSSSSDGGDMACADLLSLRSDSLSLTSEAAASRRSEEDDSRSVAASSVMSLFHRVQLDPLEKDWLRSSALGNMSTQHQLLAQEPGLVSKKTALHWAAKQGRQEAVDMMLCSGADVNVRSGYTALHLASIHGHQHIVHALINTYDARTNIRDYHGKMAAHYWSGSTDVFSRAESQAGGMRTQRHARPSFLLSRSRSQGQLSLEFGTLPHSASHDDVRV